MFQFLLNFIFRVFDRFMRDYEKFKIKRMKSCFKSCGNNVEINNVAITPWPKVEVGDNVIINSYTNIFAGGGVIIGSGTLISSNCVIVSVTHPTNTTDRFNAECIRKPVTIGQNVWIGAGVIILPGVYIGNNSVIGAGAIVTKDVPSNTVVVGNPARILRTMEF
ncbi:DapH/DapD/GlmU-related protein [Thermosynechococcaceae cyanobacterium BACA0444]|uniref:DapH/DapD/GlmU-related protein n=1 Tax=Pseudocalidococcus azoricus BACA0444 TaxID=2918990 RepID=A0AAE4FNJ4_9CYAN|nr:DapH/DapD/GlmU-related protein [Pseudocalidococcus azoricus]MDS3859250.1 DapH/DapD/GlmU-related protein [Pseudocalidococcus azoricus BACA0444]